MDPKLGNEQHLLSIYDWFERVAVERPKEFKKRYLAHVDENHLLLRECKTRNRILTGVYETIITAWKLMPRPFWYEKALDDYQNYKDQFNKGIYELTPEEK